MSYTAATTDLRIRLMDEAHLSAAVALFEAQMREHEITTGGEEIKAALRMFLQEPRYGFVLLALADNSVVGVAAASSLLSLEYGGVSGWLEELYVHPAWRSRGIGSQLVAGVLERAEALGWKAVDLEVEADHERAAGLYLRHGFQRHTRTRYYRIVSGESPFLPAA